MSPLPHWSRARRLLVALPDLVIWGTLCVSPVVALALLTGVFLPAVVLPLGVLAVVAGARFRPPAVRPDLLAVIGSGITLAVALAWFVIQSRHTGEAIGVGRDPSQYTLAGLYLVDHHAPGVVLPGSAVDLAHAVPGLRTNFISDDVTAVNNIQGTSLLPGFLAMFGWIFGVGGVFTANVALGALGLIAVYAMGRRIVGPLWALLPVGALASTMPLAEFARTPYTETLALIFAAGTVLGLWIAAEDGRWSAAVLAGACAGGAMLARIDGGIVIIGGVVGLTLVAVATPDPALRARRRRALVLFVGSAAPLGLLGWLDLRIHSPKYLHDLSNLLYPVLAGTAVLAVLGWLGTGSRGARLIGRLRPRRRRWGMVTGVLAALIAVFLVSRPWWMVNHGQVNPDYWPAVEWRQRNEGLPLDGRQSYDEMTVSWMAWYFGWALVVAGLAGGILAAMDGVRRDTRLLAAAAVPAVAAAFYLNRISITADQIWAFRRLLPVIVPGLLLGAAYALRALHRKLPEVRWSPSGPARDRVRLGSAVPATLRRWARPAVPVAAALMTVLPALTWGPMFGPREGAGIHQLGQQMCDLAQGGLFVQVGGYAATGTMLPAVQELCPGTAAVSTFSQSPVTLQQIAAHWQGPGPITVISYTSGVLFPAGPNGQAPWRTVRTPQWESVISHRPRQVTTATVQVWAGRLTPAGQVRPISPFPGLG